MDPLLSHSRLMVPFFSPKLLARALWLLLQVWVPILWFSTPSPTYQSSALSESCFLVSTVDPVLSGTYPMGSPLVCVSLQAGIGLKEALPALLKLPPGPSVC